VFYDGLQVTLPEPRGKKMIDQEVQPSASYNMDTYDVDDILLGKVADTLKKDGY